MEAFSHANRTAEIRGIVGSLQNEKQLVPASVKIELINQLADTGLPVVECTSFVSKRWVPQVRAPQARLRCCVAGFASSVCSDRDSCD